MSVHLSVKWRKLKHATSSCRLIPSPNRIGVYKICYVYNICYSKKWPEVLHNISGAYTFLVTLSRLDDWSVQSLSIGSIMADQLYLVENILKLEQSATVIYLVLPIQRSKLLEIALSRGGYANVYRIILKYFLAIICLIDPSKNHCATIRRTNKCSWEENYYYFRLTAGNHLRLALYNTTTALNDRIQNETIR